MLFNNYIVVNVPGVERLLLPPPSTQRLPSPPLPHTHTKRPYLKTPPVNPPPFPFPCSVQIWEIGAAQEDSDAPSNREKVTGSPPARVKSLERSDSDVSLASLTSVVSISTTAGGSSRERESRRSNRSRV